MDSSKKSEKEKPHQKKIFYVDPQRAELDQYMLKKIKKNGRSVKKLTAELSNLLTKINTLNSEKEKNSHYFRPILKDPTLSPSSNSKTFSKYENSQIYNLYTNRNSSIKQRSTHRKPTVASKGSKCSSKQSRSFREEKKNRKKSLDTRNSKHLLGKKIKDLKQQAKLAQHERQQIKLKVNKKINQRALDIQQKQYIQNSLRQAYLTGGFYRNEQKNGKFNKYNQLFSNERLSNSYIQVKKYHTEQGDEKSLQFEEKRLMIKNQGSNQNTKTSNTSEKEERNNKHSSKYQTFQINNQFSVTTMSPSSKKLNFSRCIDIQISKPQAKGSSSSIPSIQKIQPKQGLQFSKYKEKTKSKTKLQQLQDRFDALVRKQLIASTDIQKKQIRVEIKQVLTQISNLKRNNEYYK